jgi:hypothetical protein
MGMLLLLSVQTDLICATERIILGAAAGVCCTVFSLFQSGVLLDLRALSSSALHSRAQSCM